LHCYTVRTNSINNHRFAIIEFKYPSGKKSALETTSHRVFKDVVIKVEGYLSRGKKFNQKLKEEGDQSLQEPSKFIISSNRQHTIKKQRSEYIVNKKISDKSQKQGIYKILISSQKIDWRHENDWFSLGSNTGSLNGSFQSSDATSNLYLNSESYIAMHSRILRTMIILNSRLQGVNHTSKCRKTNGIVF